ncbi:hypothetical protein X762_31975 [Mesorhizobium sp. LSHC426A00]|nr:hypothetical protein X762_31975 [Mesorhizobium sp. LSHC426A00]
MILPSLKHLAKPLFQSQKLLWIGWRLVSSTIEQRPERLGHVLLKAHSPGLDRLPVFQAGVLHLRQSCYTGWITISRVHTSLTSNCIVKVLRQFTQRVIELRFCGERLLCSRQGRRLREGACLAFKDAFQNAIRKYRTFLNFNGGRPLMRTIS